MVNKILKKVLKIFMWIVLLWFAFIGAVVTFTDPPSEDDCVPTLEYHPTGKVENV